MNQRQEQILTYTIDEYVRTAAPVSSKLLVDKFKLDVSGATVRNDYQLLEKEGYLMHPHTSAGRVPTEKGYRFFLTSKFETQNSKLRNNNYLLKKDTQALEIVYNETKELDTRHRIKNMAKKLAELAGTAVLVGFNKRDSFYTGLSYLFAQPEFRDYDLACNVTEVVDSLDETIAKIYDKFPGTVTAKIGSQNPFAQECSFIGTKFNDGTQDRLLGLLGPVRMPYLAHIGRLEYARKLLIG